MKHRNTTSREKKKDVQNFVFRCKETQSFKKQKYVWQYIQKKPNKNLAVIYINTGYWGVFTNELSRKEKKKKEKKMQSQESYKYDVLEK